jgi:hypothetical protein
VIFGRERRLINEKGHRSQQNRLTTSCKTVSPIGISTTTLLQPWKFPESSGACDAGRSLYAICDGRLSTSLKPLSDRTRGIPLLILAPEAVGRRDDRLTKRTSDCRDRFGKRASVPKRGWTMMKKGRRKKVPSGCDEADGAGRVGDRLKPLPVASKPGLVRGHDRVADKRFYLSLAQPIQKGATKEPVGAGGGTKNE